MKTDVIYILVENYSYWIVLRNFPQRDDTPRLAHDFLS